MAAIDGLKLNCMKNPLLWDTRLHRGLSLVGGKEGDLLEGDF